MSLKGKRILIIGDSHTAGAFGTPLKAALVSEGAAVQRIDCRRSPVRTPRLLQPS